MDGCRMVGRKSNEPSSIQGKIVNREQEFIKPEEFTKKKSQESEII